MVGGKIEVVFSLIYTQSRGRASSASEAALGCAASLGGKWLLGFKPLYLCTSQPASKKKEVKRRPPVPVRICLEIRHFPLESIPGTESHTHSLAAREAVTSTRPPCARLES